MGEGPVTLAAGPVGVGPEQEVLGHRHERKQMPPLGDLHDAAVDPLMSRQGGEVFVVQKDAAAARSHEPGDHAQGGGLAGGVGADQRDDLLVADLERDIGERLEVAIERVDPLKPEQARTPRRGTRRRPGGPA